MGAFWQKEAKLPMRPPPFPRLITLVKNSHSKDTIKATFEIIKERMNDYVKFFVHTKVDMFKWKVLLELPIHSQFNHLFQSCQINEKLLNFGKTL